MVGSLFRAGLLITLLGLTFVTSPRAETFYVRQSGSDGPETSGTSPSSAFATVGFAASRA